MRSFQDIIEEQLKIIKDGDEIITPDEFHLICEAERYRPPGEKWYSKHRSLTSWSSKVGAGFATIATLGLYGLYRRMTDKCKQRCRRMTGRQAIRCNSLCNMTAAKHVVDKLQSRKSALSSIKDPEKRREASDDLRREYEKWLDRYEKYKNRVEAGSMVITQLKTKKD